MTPRQKKEIQSGRALGVLTRVDGSARSGHSEPTEAALSTGSHLVPTGHGTRSPTNGPSLDRRTLLAGLLCASVRASAAPSRPLAPVVASRDRVIGVTAGLRPHRPEGFRVGIERLGGRTVIHDYGHGGAGMSLAWGTGWLAAELAREAAPEPRAAAVLGAGTAGLTAARQLQRRGFAVTVYASALPRETTSNRSLACWSPLSGLFAGPVGAPFDEQLAIATRISNRELGALTGRDYGVTWMDAYTATDRPPEPAPETHLLGPGEHPFPTRYATMHRTLRIEPARYLDALARDVRTAGGRLVVRSFASLREVLTLPEPLIVNCTGLGASALFGDRSLAPVRGRLVLLAPQPGIDYCIAGIHPDRELLHMAPRSDSIALGGTFEPGETSIDPDEAATDRILEAHARFFDAMRPTGG